MAGVKKPATYAGVDVGGKELVVSLVRGGGEIVRLKVPNTAEGHQTLVRALRKKPGLCRVVLEATGSFHLDLALVLSKARGIELMVVNPLAARRFAQALMTRAKTDRVDADVLLLYAQRMDFVSWTRPTDQVLELRTVTRHLASLIADQTAIKNRLQAARVTETTPTFVLDDLQGQLDAIAPRIARCQAEARRLTDADPDLKVAFDSLDSAPGIGERSALVLLGELAVLDPSMTPDEVVSHAGLDPRPVQSGMRGNADTARKISKVGNARVRAALYMVALTACRDPGVVRNFFERLTAKNKPSFVAHVAVMRRMLRVAWVLMVRKITWDGSLFAPRPPRPAVAS
jgi:transposase